MYLNILSQLPYLLETLPSPMEINKVGEWYDVFDDLLQSSKKPENYFPNFVAVYCF